MIGGTAAVLALAANGGARAFPYLDPTNADSSPAVTDLGPTETQDLRRQLQLSEGIAPPPGGGWTVIPRIEIDEAVNDNILQLGSPRRADLITYVTPSLAVAADTSHLKLTLDWAPSMALYLQNGSQNLLTQQLSSVGLLTLVPDRFYVDLRANAAVQATNGGFAGAGALALANPSGGVGWAGAGAAGLGLSRNNTSQTFSLGVSPYTIGRLGGSGEYKIGTSVNVAHVATARGATSLSGTGATTGAQTLLTTEQLARFSSGDALEHVQDVLTVDLSQSSGSYDQTSILGQPVPGSSTYSSRETVSNKVTWRWDEHVAVFASLGWESLRYTGTSGYRLDEATWSIGATLSPNPDSFLTLSYGHQNGANSLDLSARWAVTGRTTLTASYGSSVGTQLQNLQRQLNLAAASTSGGLVDAQTGGSLANGTSLLPIQPGVYRFDTFSLNGTTVWDRDLVTFALGFTRQTSVGSGIGSNAASETKYASAQWRHELSPATSLTAGLSYSRVGYLTAGGNTRYVVASLLVQQRLNETLTAFARYLFVDQASVIPNQTMYQNVALVGVSKQF